MGDSVERTLKANEAIVAKGRATFMEVGEALAAIRDAKQYREAGFSSFDAYCQERWGFTANYARRQIIAAADAKSVPTGTLLPRTERAARALRKPVEVASRGVTDDTQQERGEQPRAAGATASRGAQPPSAPATQTQLQDQLRATVTGLVAVIGVALTRDLLLSHANRLATPTPKPANTAAATNGKCAHPKSKEDKKPYGVWCGVCRVKVR